MSEELEELKKKSACQEDRIDLMEERYLDIASKMDSILKRQQIYTEEMVHFREHLMEALTAKSQENKEIQETITGLQENNNNRWCSSLYIRYRLVLNSCIKYRCLFKY